MKKVMLDKNIVIGNNYSLFQAAQDRGRIVVLPQNGRHYCSACGLRPEVGEVVLTRRLDGSIHGWLAVSGMFGPVAEDVEVVTASMDCYE